MKIKNKRNDFLHKISNKLSENQTVKVEDLKIKGSVENPNMRASAKSGFNRSILQQSWGERNGGELIKVDPKHTSQKCSRCGYILKENRLKQAEFICIKCNYRANADYNASINILDAVGTTVKAS